MSTAQNLPAPTDLSQHNATPGAVPPAPAVPTQAAQTVPAVPQVVPTGQPYGTPPAAAVPPVAQPQTPPADPVVEALRQGMQPAAPAPATPQAPSTPPTNPDGVDLNSVDVNTLQDPQLRMLGNLMLGFAPGLDLNRALGKAIEYGDPQLVDAAYLREIGGDKAQALVDAARQAVVVANEYSDRVTREVHSLAGGEPGWNTAVAVFNSKADPAVRRVVAGLFNSTNLEDVKQGAQYVLNFSRDQGQVTQAPELVVPAGGGVPGTSVQGLSKVEFQKAHFALDPNAPDYADKRQQLLALRSIGKRRGL